MAERLVEVDAVQFRRVFPWVHLFRAFRIAVDIRKICLAALALIALAVGNEAFSRLPFAPSGAHSQVSWPWQEQTGIKYPLQLPGDFLANPAPTLVRIFSDWKTPIRTLDSVVAPARALLQPRRTWSELAYSWTQLLWAFFVWGLFAGAITRMAALQFAGEPKVGMWGALRFSGENFFSYLSAPLLPVVGIGALWVLCMLGGLIGRIPVGGPVIVGVFWWLAMAVGLLMTLIVIGVAAGWPLMYAAISTEGSDGYDGFSRAYGYVFSRPWQYLGFIVVSLVYGSALIAFVTFAVTMAVFLAGRSISTGMGADAGQSMLAGNPNMLGGNSILDTGAVIDATIWGSTPAGFWMQMAALLVSGFVASYFWSASTIIYFLLRQSDDATDLKEVYLPEEIEEDELLPLVGVADSTHPVVERPIVPVPPRPPKSDGTEDTEYDIRTNPTARDAK